MSEKIKVLCWADSPVVSTGFGVVAKNVISALQATGKYEIHQLAINHDGRFVEDNSIGWQIQPAKLLNPNDPFGNQMFINSVLKNNYDIIWILNDAYATHSVSKALNEVRQKKAQSGEKIPKVVYYYPVDCQVIPEGAGMLQEADVLVAYTSHGKAETIRAIPDVAGKMQQIPHGVDSSVFRPLEKEYVRQVRKQHLAVNDETFVIANINRNTTRKQIPYSLLAFKEFRKHVPNSLMYIHAAYHDQGGDLLLAARDLGFNLKTDVIFPVKYNPSAGVSEKALNELYNSADMYLTTHLGEGWGLTISEAMSAGTPVVVPNNTCMPQLVGEGEERGYMYECRDSTFIDNSGYRPKGYLEDIVSKMLEAYEDFKAGKVEKQTAAREWAVQHDWNKVCLNWVKLFDDLIDQKPANLQQGVGEAI